jgi:hypothetical protein
MQLSINQLSDLTGKDRRTISSRLKDLAYVDGEKGAYLYEASEALELIYGTGSTSAAGKTLDGAKTEAALEQAALSRVRREEIQRHRIPLNIVASIWEGALTACSAKLKAARGKKLDAPLINTLLAEFRAAKLPVSW